MMSRSSSLQNILFICCDDLNAWISPIGRYPGTVHTPALGKLASDGTTFRYAYCAAPHCNPSRASVFSGRRPTTTGVYHEERLGDAFSAELLPRHLRRAGYRVFAAGKVLHGNFDYTSATRDYSDRAVWNDTHGDPDAWDEYHPCADEPQPENRPFNGFFDFRRDPVPPWYQHFDWGPLPDHQAHRLPDVEVVARASEFLERQAGPFFCAVGLYRPHLPWYVPARYFDLYPLEEIRLPEVFPDELKQVPKMAREWAETPADYNLVRTTGQWRHAVRGYLASISFCDAMIAQLLEAVDRAGRAADTAIIVWGDNGFHLGEKLHWRKFTLWEEATRVPLLIRAPGCAEAGHRPSQPVSLLDLYPTILEMLGLPGASHLDGESLVPWLRPGASGHRGPPISTWLEGNHSVRMSHWRYTRYRDGSEELYDHRSDPRERINLAASQQGARAKAWLRPYLANLD